MVDVHVTGPIYGTEVSKRNCGTCRHRFQWRNSELGWCERISGTVSDPDAFLVSVDMPALWTAESFSCSLWERKP